MRRNLMRPAILACLAQLAVLAATVRLCPRSARLPVRRELLITDPFVEYQRRFGQESVLRVVDETCVSFY